MPATTCMELAAKQIDLVAGPSALNRFKERIWYIHLKDLEPSVARAPARGGTVGLLYRAMRNGLYPELGKGCVTSLLFCAGLRLVD